MSDIQIKTCLTVFTDEYGRNWILVLNQVIWFGFVIDHSLVNINQMNMTGTPFSDDPFDVTRRLVIHHEYAFIPFKTDGTTVYFDTHVPTGQKGCSAHGLQRPGTRNGTHHWCA